MRILEKYSALALCLFLAFFVLLQNPISALGVDQTEPEEEVDEEAKDELEEDIEDVQEKIEKEEKKKEEIQQNLYNIQSSVNRTQYEINKTENKISETEETMNRKEKEIKSLTEKIDFQKKILSGLIQAIYAERLSIKILGVSNDDRLPQFMGVSDSMATLNKKMNDLISEIQMSRQKVSQEVEELESAKKNHEKLLSLKEDQQSVLLSQKSETQTDLNEKQATISELQSKLYKLRSNLSALLGESFDAGDIEEAASYASKKTGVRKDFIMGMLVVESDLGRFTGGCDYKESRMSDYRKEIFKDICEELDYNYKKMKVSCPPSGYSGTGGAMGVAQFMPDTWLGYKSQVASLTGHNPPDPWDLTDGVVAMALKLAKGGATSKSGECNAAKLYLSGTTSSAYNWYCDRVKYWADNYERLLD